MDDDVTVQAHWKLYWHRQELKQNGSNPGMSAAEKVTLRHASEE